MSKREATITPVPARLRDVFICPKVPCLMGAILPLYCQHFIRQRSFVLSPHPGGYPVGIDVQFIQD